MDNALQIDVTNRKVELNLPPLHPIKADIDVEGVYLIASNRALFLIRDRTLHRVLLGNFYGITQVAGSVYAYQSVGKVGRVLKFDIDRSGEIDPAAEIAFADLPGWCHQIDVFDDSLFLTDTPNNRIIQWDFHSRRWREHYPLGRIDNGKASANYGHMNSIYHHNGHMFIVCHNNTMKTGKPSEILVLDKWFNILEVLSTDSSCAHNIVIHRGRTFHCDSLKKSLKADGRVVFTGDHFTRGLSVSANQILVGGSVFAKREERQNKNGHLYALHADCSLRASLMVPGMVQEIRRLDETDYSLSVHSNKTKTRREEPVLAERG